MAALTTVQNFVDAARELLQDENSGGYRYSDADLVDALNQGILEAVRVRPDLFFKLLRTGGVIPSYTAASMGTTVALDQRYCPAFVYYIAGRAQLRDDESTQDQRATVFIGKFVAQLTAQAA